MTRTCLLFPLLWGIPFFAFTQTATIEGRVTDQEGVALPGATIAAKAEGTITDPDGRYRLELPAGPHTLTCSYIGFEPITRRIKVEEGQTYTQDFTLESAPTLLETTTVSSSRYEKPLSEVTVSLELVKPQLIDNTNTTSIDEVLDKIPGVVINSEQANIRGGSGWSYGAGSRVLLLIDDIPILQPDAGVPNWDDVPVENIAQIEVIKGAASALYGSAAMNGIINVRTAYAKSEPETRVSTFYTLYDGPADEEKKWWGSGEQPFQSGLSFSHRQKFDKLDMVLGGYGLYQESFNEGWLNRYGRLNGSFRYRFSDRLTAQVNTNFNAGKTHEFFYFRDPENGVYTGDTTTYSATRRLRYFIDPQLTYFTPNGDRHRFSGRFFSVDNESDNNQTNSSQLYYGEYQFQKRWNPTGTVVTLGGVSSHVNSDAQLFGDNSFRLRNLAGYAQVEQPVGERLNLSAGVRYEYNQIKSPDSVQISDTERIPSINQSEGKPVFRAGLNYQAAEGTFLRASWGQGYRFPTLAEKFIRTNSGGIFVQPNPDLQSETGWSAELGVKQGLKVGSWAGYLDFSVFQSEYQDMIEFNVGVNLGGTVPFFFQAVNVGNTRIRGLELTLAGQSSLGADTEISVLGGYTLLDPEFKEWNNDLEGVNLTNYDEFPIGVQNAFNSTNRADNVLKYRSRHSVKMDVQIDRGAFFGGLAYIYTSRMENIDFFLSVVPAGLVTYWEDNPQGAHLFNLRLGYRLGDRYKITLLGKNLLNQEYFRRPGLLEPTRNFTLRIDANL